MAIMRSQPKKQKQQRKKYLPCWYLNHGPPEPKAGVLPMSYADPFCLLNWFQVEVVEGLAQEETREECHR